MEIKGGLKINTQKILDSAVVGFLRSRLLLVQFMRSKAVIVILFVLLLAAVVLAYGFLSMQNDNKKLRSELAEATERVSVLELSAKGLADELNEKQTETETMLLQLDVLAENVRSLETKLEEKTKEAEEAAKENVEIPAAAVALAGSEGSVEPVAISSSEALEKIIQYESKGNPNAVNPSGPYCGIGQLAASHYPKYVGKTWEECAGNYDIQLQAMMGYINDRYGSPEAAWNHILETGWY
jgi:flagellar motility protein MotE (MotC chaperone)